MKRCRVLVDTDPRKKSPRRLGLVEHEVLAENRLAAGWRLIQSPQKGEPLTAAHIVATAEEDGPYLPWAGLLKDRDPRVRTTRQHEFVCRYETDGEEREIAFEMCAASIEECEAVLNMLEVFQPDHLANLAFGHPERRSIVRKLH